jgi:hypothetical protein
VGDLPTTARVWPAFCWLQFRMSLQPTEVAVTGCPPLKIGMHGGVRRADDEAKRAAFNPGQRLLAWARGASVATMAVTGVQAWPSNQTRSSHGMAVAVTVLLSRQFCMAGLNPPPDLRS